MPISSCLSLASKNACVRRTASNKVTWTMADSIKRNPPEVKLIYHSNGEIAEVNISLPIPQTQNPPLKRKRSRLDSGFDDDPTIVVGDAKFDETILFNKVPEEEATDEDVFTPKELRMDLTKIDSKECDTDDEVGISSGQPMITSDKKFDFGQASFVSQMLGSKQPCNMVLILLVVFLLLGMVALLIVHFSATKVEDFQEENNSTAMLALHHMRTPTAPSFFHCPLDCFNKSKRLLSITNGRASCDNNIIHLECEPGFESETELSVTCENLNQMRKPIKCLPSSRCKDQNQSGCGADVLLLAGGEVNGKLLDTLETFPMSAFSGCLPPLPHPLKWGSLAFMQNSLILCGGENSAEQPSKSCWILEKGRQWRWFGDLAR